jgi:NADH:ubiquinone oxidoreductase subunit 2 (subunit N)
MENNLDKRYQTLIILWFGQLMSIGMFFLFTVFAAPGISTESGNPSRSLLIVALTALGTFLVIVSFAVKGKLLERSVENQDVSLVQKALVIACAMCEVSALLGLIERFLIGNREYYLLFLLAAAGIAFHFPRRSQLESASYKNPAQLG